MAWVLLLPRRVTARLWDHGGQLWMTDHGLVAGGWRFSTGNREGTDGNRRKIQSPRTSRARLSSPLLRHRHGQNCTATRSRCICTGGAFCNWRGAVGRGDQGSDHLCPNHKFGVRAAISVRAQAANRLGADPDQLAAFFETSSNCSGPDFQRATLES